MKTTRSLIAIATLLAVGACDDDRASVFSPVGPPSYDFTVAAALLNAPAGTATISAASDSVTLTLSGLRDLAGSTYQFWAVNRDSINGDVYTTTSGSVVEFFNFDTGTTDPVTGDPIFAVDSNIVSATPTNSYVGYSTATQDIFSVRIILDQTGDASTVGNANAVFVTIESGAATSPGAARFLWRRIGPGGSGAMTFGNFGGTDAISAASPTDYVYQTIGVGRGGVRGAEFSVDFDRIGRPPVGFSYRGYLIDSTGVPTLVDVLRSPFTGVAAESRIDLSNADVDDLLPGVVADGVSGQIRTCGAGSGVADCPQEGQTAFTLPGAIDISSGNADPDQPWTQWRAFRSFVLTLDPKAAGSGIGLTETYTGVLPEIVFK